MLVEYFFFCQNVGLSGVLLSLVWIESTLIETLVQASKTTEDGALGRNVKRISAKKRQFQKRFKITDLRISFGYLLFRSTIVDPLLVCSIVVSSLWLLTSPKEGALTSIIPSVQMFNRNMRQIYFSPAQRNAISLSIGTFLTNYDVTCRKL